MGNKKGISLVLIWQTHDEAFFEKVSTYGVCRWLNFYFEINQTSKIVSQMWIYIDECVVQISEITKEWFSDSISLQDLLIGIVVMWFWLEHKISFNLVEEWIEDLWRELQWISSYELVRNSFIFTFFVFFVFFVCSSSLKVCGGSSSVL